MRSRRASIRWPAPGSPDDSPTPPPQKAVAPPARRTAAARLHRSGAIRATDAAARRTRSPAGPDRLSGPRRRQAVGTKPALLALARPTPTGATLRKPLLLVPSIHKTPFILRPL